MTVPSPITARPVVSARIAIAVGLFVLAVFETVAVVMRTDDAGATFYTSDQVATAIIGVFAGAAFWPLTRPRVVADADTIRFRGYFGTWRAVPWSMVRAVEFPSSVRFARIVLAADETLALYAVQRLDKQRAIATMRGLRALHAQATGAAAGR